MTENIKTTLNHCKELIRNLQSENDIPGIVVGASVNGETVWQEGVGYLDLENDIPCEVNAVMRTASVCKTFTAVTAAKLWEEGKLNWDQPIRQYLPDYPEIIHDGKNVSDLVTPRLLVSQLGGFRHYNRQKGEFERKEHYSTMTAALSTFKNEPLPHKPGTHFLYSGFGFTLLGTIIEKVSGVSFVDRMKIMTNYLGMNNTDPDNSDVLIKRRSKFYSKSDSGTILNAPYADSCKWASGGYLSTVPDLIKFGNVLISSYHGREGSYLKPETVKLLWTPNELSQGKIDWESNGSYGMGFVITRHGEHFGASHIGRATGGSAVLFIIPNEIGGVAVSIMANLEKVDLHNLAKKIALLLHEDAVN